MPVQGLVVNATAEVSMTLKDGPTGRIEIIADYDRDIYECNEINNSLILMFTPPPSCTPTVTIIP